MIKTKDRGIYRRGDRYVAIVTYRDGAGRSRQKWLTHNTLKAAKDARRVFLNDLDKGIKPDGSKMTVSELIDLWLEEVRVTRRPTTLRVYMVVANRHIAPNRGCSLEGSRSRAHCGLRAEATHAPGGAANPRGALVGPVMGATKDKGYIAANPCASVRAPKVERKEARHLDLAEAKRILSVAKDNELEPAIILGLIGGLRIAEAVSVTWGDVDLEAGSLTVRRSYWGKTKSGRMRGLTLPADTIAVLRRIKTVQARALLSIGVRQDDATPVYADPVGRFVEPGQLGVRFRRFCTEHGFDASFHSLRHTAAIMMLTAGIDVKTAASRLGHSSPVLLLDVYSHFIESADRAAADRVGALLRG